MQSYNLDEKSGIMRFFRKKPSKILQKDDMIDFRHFSIFNPLKMNIVNATDSQVTLRTEEKNPDLSISIGDNVVLTYLSDKGYYVISGDIAAIESLDPLNITVNLRFFKKSTELRKENKKYVSILGTISPSEQADSPDKKTFSAIVKAMGIRAIKVDCKEDLQLGNIVDVYANIDKKNKLYFKGQIVRKNKNGNIFEYGIEVREITESNSKLMHQCVADMVE